MPDLKSTLLAVLVTISHFYVFANNTFPKRYYPGAGNASVIKSSKPNNKATKSTFSVELGEKPGVTDRVWLVYELKGVQDHSAVCRSINDQLSFGGYLVQQNEMWTEQREQLNPKWLKQGRNFIRFSVFNEAEHEYQVRNLGIVIEPGIDAEFKDRQLVISHQGAEYFDGQAYVKGYVAGLRSGGTAVYIDGVIVPVMGGAFEYVIKKPEENLSTEWNITVEARFLDGVILKRNIQYSKHKKADYSFDFSNRSSSVVKQAFPGEQNEIMLNAASFLLDKDAILKPETFSLTSLRTIDLHALPQGMVNVTATNKAYRLNPGDFVFNNKINVQLGYDASKIPNGYTPDDIKTYRFNHSSNKWEMLDRKKVDFGKNAIVSGSNEGGDYINGIIQQPESPESANYTPTEIKDLKAANPSASINLIQPPVANNMGTANLSYPIVVPPGRQGIQPQLALTYNSDGGHSWCGLGWDLSIPAISIDTRWGVPRYHDTQESEIYSMNGQQLTFMLNDDTGYMANNSAPQMRNTVETTRQFYPRVEGAFQKIIRHGTHPTEYFWEVIDKTGTRYFYGGNPETGVVASSVLRTYPEGNIGYWALYEVRDLNENFMRYHCQLEKHRGVGGVVGDPADDKGQGYQIYIDRITYTGHDDIEGKYSVKFHRELGRPDINIDARLGFKRVTASRLEKIEIVKDNAIAIRSYEMVYKTGAFEKSLLEKIEVYDAEGALFNVHNLDYYDDVRDDNLEYKPLESAAENWTTHNDGVQGNFINPIEHFNDMPSALSGNKNSNWSVGGAITVGLNLDGKLYCKSYTIGGDFSFFKVKGKRNGCSH